jgi:lipid A 4'-phosphatase
MRRRAGLLLLGVTILASALFLIAPRLDIAVGQTMLRADGHFLLYYERNSYLFHLALQYAAPIILAFCVVAVIAWRLRRPISGITAWQALYVALVLAIGPGLLINSVLKDNSHRPRPASVQEFGGPEPYAPPFDFAGVCDVNCSFVAGDPAIGFALLAPALLLPPRRRGAGIAVALGLGALLGLMRMLQGGHFLSDVIFSGIVVSATVLGLHWAMFTADGAPRGRWGRQLSVRA